MSRTITVKGIGRAVAKPDYVVISMAVDSRDMKYDKAMEAAAQNMDNLNQALERAGFEKDAVKTTNFNVRTDYMSVRDQNGDYRQQFNGYVVSHNLKLEFELDTQLLSRALSAVTECAVNPQLSVAFTVKDVAAVNGEMLSSATKNAREKAEILCGAAGVELGALLEINYNWNELEITSRTRYSLTEDCVAMPLAAKAVDIRPEDIDISDTATFVWEIV